MQWSEAIKEHIDAVQAVKVNAASLEKIWRLLDLTSLNENDTEASIALFLEKANSVYGHVAAVCIYPAFVPIAHAQFENTSVKTATVANFPRGDGLLKEVLVEINQALEMGAEEIDVVFPYERYLAGETQYARTFVESCKAACGNNVTLKVILETGALGDLAIIADASYEVLAAGADFIKTSTGKITQGATLEAACTMLLAIRHLRQQIKRPLGFKAAGGVREINQAVQYLALADRIMGENWVSQQTFRIGASKLADELISAGLNNKIL